MRKMVKKVLVLCMATTMVVGMSTTALALDQSIKYDGDGHSDLISSYTVKNAAKKLNSTITWSNDSNSKLSLPNCFEGVLNTTIDVSGMERYAINLLEKQSDGSYVSVKSGAELKDYIDWDHVSDKGDQALIEKYLNSDEALERYKEVAEYYNSADYKALTAEQGPDLYPPINSFEDYKAVIKNVGSKNDLAMEYDIDLALTGFDKGSYFKFTKPGVYLVSATKGYSPKEQPFEKYATVLFIGASDSNTITATITTSKVFVDGKEIAFDAYTINGNNYFKLRDVAQVASGSGKQFQVTWDGTKNAINLVSGQAYTVVGGELAKGDGKTKTASASTSAIYKDGSVINLTAYSIGGNNYFKLRDLGQTFDFDVSWDVAKNAVLIDTKSSYTAD